MPPCTLSVRAVLFDLDGVLVDSTGAVEEHWRAFAARHELDPERLLEDLHGRRMVDIITRALPDLTAEQHAHESRWLEGLEADGARESTAILPGALELTRALHGVPWAIVTSGTMPVASARIAAVGLPEPPVLVTGDQVPAGKPDPGPYLLAARRLEVAPGDCVVVEDAPAGLAAGHGAGCTTVGVTASHAFDELDLADHVVATPAGIHPRPGTMIELELDCVRQDSATHAS